MGLSNEERLSQFYGCMRGWRALLVDLRATVITDYSSDSRASTVLRWIREVDAMTGEMIASTDASSVYWIMGQNEDGYRSLFEDAYDLAQDAPTPDKHSNEPHFGSPMYWESGLDLKEFARRLSEDGGEFSSPYRDEIKSLAAYWTQWDYVAAILYPMRRYPDKLFPQKVERRFVRLVGEIANSRYMICNSSAVSGVHDHEKHVGPYEHALLCKWRLYGVMVTKLTNEIAAGLKSEAYVEKMYRSNWDEGGKLIKQIGKMSLVEVARRLKQDQMEKSKASRFNHDEPKKIDGIMGPAPRSEETLRKIIYGGTDCEVVKAAAEEMYAVYSCHINWEHRFGPKKSAGKKPAKKVQK